MAQTVSWVNLATEGGSFTLTESSTVRFGQFANFNGATNTEFWYEKTLEAGTYLASGSVFDSQLGQAVIKVAQLKVVTVVADVTLTDKTKSFAIGVMTKINAIITKVNSLTGRVTAVETLAASKAAIDDTNNYSTTTTLSSSKIGEVVGQVWSNAQTYANSAALTAKNEAIAQLSGVDGTQLAALNSLSAALAANDAADGVITNTLLGKVGFNEAQTLTDAQAAQARANIKFDSAVAAALLATVGDVSTFDPDAILATALTLN